MSKTPQPSIGINGPTELEELIFKQKRVVDESLYSTRKMVELCEETKEAGIKTLVAMDEQGEQLENTEKGLKKVHEDIMDARDTLSQMKTLDFCCCFESCKLPCQKACGKEIDKILKNEDGKVISGQPKHWDCPATINSGYISRITNDPAEDEMEQNMQKVSSIIGNIRHMTQDLSAELDIQNSSLDRQAEIVASDVVQVTEATKISGQLLRKY